MKHSYDTIGHGYSQFREADARLQTELLKALGDARLVVNVGAGTGSYEPTDRSVIAVEPSLTMIRQRGRNAAPVTQATAEALPFANNAFDGALAVLTIHHWQDWRQGIRELLRVASRRVAILTYDSSAATEFWLTEYFPEIPEIDRLSMPPIEALRKELGRSTVAPLPIPYDCTDGFLGSYWRRPHAYLNSNVRRAISTFSKMTNQEEGITRLQHDLDSGRWQQRHSDLLSRDTFDVGYRLVVATP